MDLLKDFKELFSIKSKYTLFCLYHNKVFESFYSNQINRVTFVKLGSDSFIFQSKLTLNPYRIEGNCQLGRHYSEYEFFYNLIRFHECGSLSLPEYLGFIQYDMHFSYNGAPLSKTLDRLKLTKKTLIQFVPYKFETLWNQNMNMVQNKRGNTERVNAFIKIVDDYNSFHKTNHKLEELSGKNLAMAGSFLIHKSTFLKLMKFISPIIERGELESYDKTRRHQGHLLERYVAVFLFFEKLNEQYFPIKHLGLNAK